MLTLTAERSPAMAHDAFRLSPPEAIVPPLESVAAKAVPLAAPLKTATDEQVERFIAGLLTEDLQGDAFKAKLDAAFALGREEISMTSSLMQGRFMQGNLAGIESRSAFKAIRGLRAQLDELNPGKQGDLLQPQKLLGFIPYGNKLQAYFRKYQAAGPQLQACMQKIYAARDDMQRDVLDIEATRIKLWDAMQKLGAAIHFAQTLDQQLFDKVQSLQATDPQRAKSLEQEVLFPARQNLQDMLTQQAVCTNGYLALDVLKRTGREMMNGCSRIATTGLSALAVAQTVARATGNQIQVMEMLTGVNQTVGKLIAESGRQINSHVEQTAQFAQSPMLSIDKLKDMFDQTFRAMDAMDTFRGKAIEVMRQNNRLIQSQLERADNYVDRHRQQRAREAATVALQGPVAL